MACIGQHKGLKLSLQLYMGLPTSSRETLTRPLRCEVRGGG